MEVRLAGAVCGRLKRGWLLVGWERWRLRQKLAAGYQGMPQPIPTMTVVVVPERTRTAAGGQATAGL